MFVLRLVGKILLVPVWLMLGIAWLVVHIVVSVFGFFHGLWKLFFTLVAILALAFGMYQNAVICLVAIAVTFLIMFAGVFVDVALEETRRLVGRAIVA